MYFVRLLSLHLSIFHVSTLLALGLAYQLVAPTLPKSSLKNISPLPLSSLLRLGQLKAMGYTVWVVTYFILELL